MHYEDFIDTLRRAQDEEMHFTQTGKHTLSLFRADEVEFARFHLPVLFANYDFSEQDAYLLPEHPPEYWIMLFQAGQAALGWIAEGEWVEHRVFRKYVVRKKQGKAQPLHLNQKGKSRLGSRIRLQNYKKLLEETQNRISAWHESLGALPQVVFYHVPLSVQNDFFSAALSFTKDAPAMQKISRDLPPPTFELLKEIRREVEEVSVSFLHPESKAWFA